MFKFIITRITDTERENRWAYLIDDSDECKKFLKSEYGFDIEKMHCGRWFVCTDIAQWTCQPDKFAHYYRIIDVVKEEKTVTDSLYGEIPTCAGMHTGECLCAYPNNEHTRTVQDPAIPNDICVSYSKEHGFFMSVNFTGDNEE